MNIHNQNQGNPVKNILYQSRSSLWSAGLFSCAVNLLMLTGPVLMLQVYDRVLASRSVPTLVALFALVVMLYGFSGFFDFIRNRLLSRTGYRLDVELSSLTKKAWIYSGLHSERGKIRPLNDLATLRSFLCSSGLLALFDLPWMPLYLMVVYLLHPWLGLLATAGAIIVVSATLVNEWITKKHIGEATAHELQDLRFSENTHQNAEAVIAMGMLGKITNHWKELHQKALGTGQIAGERSEFITAFTKATRMLIQSAMLALGAYLAILQEITPGTIIAASILGGRALAPVDAAIANWKNFIRFRHAYARLSEILKHFPDQEISPAIARTKGTISRFKCL